MTHTLNLPAYWHSSASSPDAHVAFRGTVHIATACRGELHILGSSWYVVWVDGAMLCDGPPRFLPSHPEYDMRAIQLTPGRHVIAVQVHHHGLATRMLPEMPPFLACRLMVDEVEIPMTWTCMPLTGYRSQVRRLNPQFGWIEWCDSRHNPLAWQHSAFDDTHWMAPVDAAVSLGPCRPLSSGPVQQWLHPLTPMASGLLAEWFGYELDDPPTRFLLRDLAPTDVPATGVWRRYDLGRVRLGRPRVVLDLPAGTVVEFGYAEALQHARVAPFIGFSTGTSCNLDHVVAHGGIQTFLPLHPKGGRFLEMHIGALPAQVRIIEEAYLERGYHGEPEGAFTCSDPLLNRIWLAGVETYRACAEDAIIDNPTRERGQWVGDALIGGEIAAVAYRDVRLMRRCLVQTAQCAREDGLVPGMTTGGLIFVASYAAQWINGCVRYVELTGDFSILHEVYPAARANLRAFEAFLTDDGLRDGVAWEFIDWGYAHGDSPVDLPMNLYFVSALRAMVRWCTLVAHPDDAAYYDRLAQRMTACLHRLFAAKFAEGEAAWAALGYHAMALGLALGFIPHAYVDDCLRAMKTHMLHCFPNNPAAPRLSDPSVQSRQLITPYFAHFAMPPLIAHGQMEFVLDQYRRCWGWALEGGRTTLVEVFDPRWSHCHQWSAAPTWQLSRYVLGLHPRFDRGIGHFLLEVHPGTLEWARGRLPMADGEIEVSWRRDGETLTYQVQTSSPLVLHHPLNAAPSPLAIPAGGSWETTLSSHDAAIRRS